VKTLSAALALVALLAAPVSATEPTACDRIAGHPQDPDGVGTGAVDDKWDHAEAVALCRADLAREPDNPRLQFILARVHFRAGEMAESIPLFEAAAAQNYRHALFVYGWLFTTGEKIAPDWCRAADLWHRAAQRDHMNGQIAFAHYGLNGKFAGCTTNVDAQEVLGFLTKAKAVKLQLSFHRNLLVENLERMARERLAAR
jgi:TPR repeat protein